MFFNPTLSIFQRGKPENPPPGTIVDMEVTRKSHYDFFLVPQTSRQGTVTPTHYIVVYDSSNTKTDHIQRLTYKLCHLYYNWWAKEWNKVYKLCTKFYVYFSGLAQFEFLLRYNTLTSWRTWWVRAFKRILTQTSPIVCTTCKVVEKVFAIVSHIFIFISKMRPFSVY